MQVNEQVVRAQLGNERTKQSKIVQVSNLYYSDVRAKKYFFFHLVSSSWANSQSITDRFTGGKRAKFIVDIPARGVIRYDTQNILGR